MIIYNVTINVDDDIVTDWLQWMKTKHIPDVMATGFFTDHKLLKMLSSEADETGKTFAVQYMLEDMGQLEKYLEKSAPKLQKESIIRYGSKMIAFRTVLEQV